MTSSDERRLLLPFSNRAIIAVIGFRAATDVGTCPRHDRLERNTNSLDGFRDHISQTKSVGQKLAGNCARWQDLYPFCSHHFEIDGHRLHFLDEGDGDALLMVHGNPTWSFYWRNLVSHFREGHRVIVPDHLGCGLSDKPQRYHYSLPQHVENLVRLIDHLDLRQVTLLAHDWGGAIGLGAAVQRLDRIARVVLFNTGAFPPPRVPRRIAICRTPVLGKLAVRGANLFAQAATWMATAKRGRIDQTIADGMLAPYDSWQNRIGIQQFVADIPLSPRHPNYDVLKQLESDIRALADRPVMLVWGMRDWCFTPACLQRFEGIFPDAEVHRIDDAGHWVVEDATAQVIQLVGDFLGRHPCDWPAIVN